jgi:hypothetical protein
LEIGQFVEEMSGSEESIRGPERECRLTTSTGSSQLHNMPLKELASAANESLKKTDPGTLRFLGDICFFSGFASIVGSILVWGLQKDTGDVAKAERLGIFIGLWAPTFFILSNRFERYADRTEKVQ